MTGELALTMSPISWASEKRAGATTCGLEWRWVTSGRTTAPRATGVCGSRPSSRVSGRTVATVGRWRSRLGIGALAHPALGSLGELLLLVVVDLLVVDILQSEVHQRPLHKRSHRQPSSKNPIVTAWDVAGEDRTGPSRAEPSSSPRRRPARGRRTCPSRAPPSPSSSRSRATCSKAFLAAVASSGRSHRHQPLDPATEPAQPGHDAGHLVRLAAAPARRDRSCRPRPAGSGARGRRR